MRGVDGRPRFRVVLALALVCCGPSVVLDEDDEGTTGGAEPPSGSTSLTPDPVTTGPTLPPSPPADSGTGSESGAIGDTSSDDDGEGGCMFLGCDFDYGSVFECDLFAQNCPPGEKCMPWANDGGAAWNATRCSPLARDPNQAGDACMVEGSGVSGIDDCDVGLMCWNVDETGLGVCEDMCTGSADEPICENPQDHCIVSNDGAIALCLGTCHPLLQECVVQNEGCWPLGEDWGCATDCGGCELGTYGDPCEYVSACDAGNVCIAAAGFSSCGDVGCCTTICDLNDAGADALCQSLDPAQTCKPWYAEGEAPVGYANVGVCMI